METPSYLDTAIQAARNAARTVMSEYRLEHQESTKTNRRDIVTDTDKRAQDAIKQKLSQDFPDIPILSEEDTVLASPRGDGELWIVDPIDGTTNYIRQIELFTIVVCLSRDRVPIVGVVYDPVHDQQYSAQVGKGANLNGISMHVSKVNQLADFTISSNMSYDNSNRLVILGNLQNLLVQVAGVRIFLSVNLELSLVARGSLDAAVIYDVDPWDVAAGALLVREAGGTVTNWEGGDWDISDRNCLASNAARHQEILQILTRG